VVCFIFGLDGSGGTDRLIHLGHVYTRIICKGANALATLKEHEYELEVLEALLAQKRWRRGRRGRWYDRRALILMTHFPKDDLDIAKRAMQGVVEALLDNDTHISRCLTDVLKPGADFL